MIIPKELPTHLCAPFIFTNPTSPTPSPSIATCSIPTTSQLDTQVPLRTRSRTTPQLRRLAKTLSVYPRGSFAEMPVCNLGILKRINKTTSKADSASPKTKNVRHEDLENDEREIALTKYRSALSKCYLV